MDRRVIAILLLFVAIGLWWVSRPAVPAPSVPRQPPAVAPAVAVDAVPPSPVAETALPAAEPIPKTPPKPRDLTHPLVPSTIPGVTAPVNSNIDAASSIDFDKISAMLRDYRTLFGENPVGTNAEIMTAIMGKNSKGAMLGPPEGQSLNEEQELLDRWGTPVFFHQLTADLMELRSAGPDRTLWTADDIVR